MKNRGIFIALSFVLILLSLNFLSSVSYQNCVTKGDLITKSGFPCTVQSVSYGAYESCYNGYEYEKMFWGSSSSIQEYKSIYKLGICVSPFSYKGLTISPVNISGYTYSTTLNNEIDSLCRIFSVTRCSICGDGLIVEGEVCDSGNLSGKTCSNLNSGFTGGTLSCNLTDCKSFNTSQCTSETPSCENIGDNGNNPYYPGSAKNTSLTGINITKNDSCSGNILTEYYCDTGSTKNILSAIVNCSAEGKICATENGMGYCKCVPKTCSEMGWDCGEGTEDRCNTQISCTSTCTAQQECNSSNKCELIQTIPDYIGVSWNNSETALDYGDEIENEIGSNISLYLFSNNSNFLVNFSIFSRKNDQNYLIKVLNSTTDSEGNVEVLWTLTQTERDAILNANISHVQFNVTNGSIWWESTIVKMKNLVTEIKYCSNYTNESACNSFSPTVANAQGGCSSISNGLCSTYIACSCSWNQSETTCQNKKVERTFCTVDDVRREVGSCTKIGINTGDNCDDGFLLTKWNSVWTWDINNTGNSTAPTKYPEDYIQNNSKWYFDPNRESEMCISDENIIPCPGRIELPFFGMYQLVVCLIAIFVIYFIKKK